MLIREVSGDPDADKLLALSQFLLSRAQDTGAQKKISVDAFINLANGMGISLTPSTLTTLSQKPPLSSTIQTIQGNEIIFKGADEDVEAEPTMSVDQARETVNSMAKRAAKRDL